MSVKFNFDEVTGALILPELPSWLFEENKETLQDVVSKKGQENIPFETSEKTIDSNSIGPINPKECSSAQEVFDQTIQTENFNDSGLDLSEDCADIYKLAGLSFEETQTVLKEQEDVKRRMQTLLQGSYTYEVVSQIGDAINIFDSEIQEHPEHAGFPRQFVKDHIDSVRTSYINMKFPDKAGISVATAEDRHTLLRSAQAFASKIALNHEYSRVEELTRVILFASTQAFVNVTCDALKGDQAMKRAECPHEKKFKTDITNLEISLTPVTNKKGVELKDQFAINLTAKIDTQHKEGFDSKRSDEENKARADLGIKPILEGQVIASAICRKIGDSWAYADIKVSNSAILAREIV